MNTKKEIKDLVKNKYSEIANSSTGNGCCGPVSSCCSESPNVEFTMIGEDYKSVNGYVPDADLGLGCGVPTEFADIKAGDTVVDLGSGAGNDVFIARSIVGESGKVIGIDMTEAMIKKSEQNRIKLGYKNVEFKLGDIENLPIESGIADVIISNCVLNLVPDKQRAFAEIFRILKPNAHFCVSDIVIKGEMLAELKKSAELYAGCVSGAIEYDEYLSLIKEIGFVNVEVKKNRRINLPDELLRNLLTEKSIEDYNKSVKGIFSITVKASKP